MAKAHEIGSRLYWQRLYYHIPNPPLFDVNTTQEIERPYRSGKCLVLRVPFTRIALVFGHWAPGKGEVEALLGAMGGRITKSNKITDYEMEDY